MSSEESASESEENTSEFENKFYIIENNDKVYYENENGTKIKSELTKKERKYLIKKIGDTKKIYDEMSRLQLIPKSTQESQEKNGYYTYTDTKNTLQKKKFQHVRSTKDKSGNTIEHYQVKDGSGAIKFLEETNNNNKSKTIDKFLNKQSEDIQAKGHNNEQLIFCFVHRDFIRKPSTQRDHIEAKSKIIKDISNMVNKINDICVNPDKTINKKKYEEIKELTTNFGISGTFIQAQNINKDNGYGNTMIYGSVFLYNLYCNYQNNVWLICNACNNEKSNKLIEDWLKDKSGGKEFLEKIKDKKEGDVFLKLNDKELGLGKGLYEHLLEHNQYIIDKYREIIEEIDNELKKEVEEIDELSEGSEKEDMKFAHDIKKTGIESIINEDVMKDITDHDLTEREREKVIKEIKKDGGDLFIKLANDKINAIREERGKKRNSGDLFDETDDEENNDEDEKHIDKRSKTTTNTGN